MQWYRKDNDDACVLNFPLNKTSVNNLSSTPSEHIGIEYVRVLYTRITKVCAMKE